ncbi:DUF167 domain-containing protein [Croceicoccus hydrothermalis]|uniref:DUF167 domain-containing protein n=1 Tax=Croceicoccus hydrothermalis TaxID=2867964 RepID=UPI001EFB6F27|nr:DUF167 family protein [Croceicoccus hydrothermalis]
MARPAPELPDADAIRAAMTGDMLAVRVTPRADRDALRIADGAVSARVRAVPEDGRANAAVAALIARAMGVAKGRVVLIDGQTSRLKRFRIAHG